MKDSDHRYGVGPIHAFLIATWTFSERSAASLTLAALLALAGYAQIPTQTSAPVAHSAPTGEVMTFVVPPDAPGAHDPQLTAVLTEAGALAVVQKRPATIQVVALVQDFRYLSQVLWNGVSVQRAGCVRLENPTVSASQPYGVTIRMRD